MVSGLVTSPCDQLRIFSGEASMMRIASKSLIGVVSSNGLERNKATLLGRPFGLSRRCFPGRLLREVCPTLGSVNDHSGQFPQILERRSHPCDEKRVARMGHPHLVG